MLYLSLEGIYQIREKNNEFLGALLISLAIIIKVSPIVLLPYLLYRKHFKAGISIVVLCVSYIFIPTLLVGWSKNMDLWSTWWTIISPDENFLDVNNRKNHGLSTLISTLFIENIEDNNNRVTIDSRRHLLDLGVDAVKVIIYSARACLVLLTLYFLRTKPFIKQVGKMHEIWEISYLLLIIPLFFPQQRLYNFIFLLPAISYLLFLLLNKKEKIKYLKMKTILFSIAVFVLNLELILGFLRRYFWHYKSITYASIVLLILLVLSPPYKQTKQQ